MATEITDQQSALKDAMARAKEMASKLQEEEDSEEELVSEEYESRKRRYMESEVEVEPNAKKACDDEEQNEDSEDSTVEDIFNGRAQNDTKNGLKDSDHDKVIHKSNYDSTDSDSSDDNNQSKAAHQEITNEVHNVTHEEEERYDENDESEEEEIEYPQIRNEAVTTHPENNVQQDVLSHNVEDSVNNIPEQHPEQHPDEHVEKEEEVKENSEKEEIQGDEKDQFVEKTDEMVSNNLENTPEVKSEEPKKETKVIKGPMLVEEVMVPSKFIGLIIGRGREMISKLQSESGAKIQVNTEDSSDSEDKPVTITGAVESVNNAKALIDEIQQSGRIPERLLSATVEGEFSVQIDIPKGKVGLIIGKGGETIKGLQEQAGCKMVMYQDGDYANAPEKPLCINGEESAVMYAKQLVEDLLEGKEPEGFQGFGEFGGIEEGVNYKEIDVPKSSVGLIIGSKGANIHYIQMETGCRVQFNNEMEGPSKTCMLSGEPYQVAAAEQMILDIIKGNSMGGPRPPFNNMGPRPPYGPRPGGWDNHMGPHGHQGWGQGPPRHGGHSNLPPDHKEMSIEVPANKCGIVIGKGGETIKSIKNETKANLQLNRNIPDNLPYKVFTVTGTDEMIENVLGMIRSKIQDQSIVAKPLDGSNQMGQAQNQWGVQANMGWGQQHNQWNYQQAWNGQQQWGQQQQNPWGQQAQAWNQSMQQPTWDAQQQQWQQSAAGQWATQQQWSQPAQTYQAGPTSAAAAQQTSSSVTSTTQAQSAANGATAASTTTSQSSTGQPDYSAAWALYYQQQQQYYQQYYQQAAVSSTATGASTAVAAQAATAASVASQNTAATATTNSQAQAMADYQAKLKEYYKQLGQ